LCLAWVLWGTGILPKYPAITLPPMPLA